MGMYIVLHGGHTSTTDHILYHKGPVTSHAVEELIDIDVVLLLQSLHHCINGNESATAANTSTVDKHANGVDDEHMQN